MPKMKSRSIGSSLVSFSLVLCSGGALAFDIIPCSDRRPGTPNEERAVATSPTSIDVSWQNTADETTVWFDLDGMGRNDSINGFGGFQGTFRQRVTKSINGLRAHPERS